jgi:hypothetical protein
MGGDTTYILDASAWIYFERHHPTDIFPTLWTRLDAQAQARRLLCPRQAVEELKQSNLGRWVRALKPSVIAKETTRVRKMAGTVMTTFPNLLHGVTHDAADPWLVAFGAEGGHIVVTQERLKHGPENLPRACDEFNVRWTSALNMLRQLGIKL